MKDLEGICDEVTPNSNMGGNEIYHACNCAKPNPRCRHMIHIDRTGKIKVGDHIKVKRNQKGDYLKVLVNGKEIDF